MRLGDGTPESHARVQSALERLWPYTAELFAEDDLDREMADRGIAPRLAEVHAAWSMRIDALLAEATLDRPRDCPYRWFGKRGEHSEHLGYILADMQYLQRDPSGCALVIAAAPALGEPTIRTQSPRHGVRSARWRTRKSRR